MKSTLQKIGKVSLAFVAAFGLIIASAYFAQTAVTSLSGLAVAENVPTTIWNSLRDGSSGDDLVRGVAASANYVYDGTNFDRVRGDTTNGIDVDVTRITGSLTPADATANPTTLNGNQVFNMVYNGTTWDMERKTTAGTAFYAIHDTGIAQVSQNFAFGFTSKKVSITASVGTNVCVDWLGATAVCPAADTAGDDYVAAGTTITLDDFATTSISVIAPGAETNTITIRAWN